MYTLLYKKKPAVKAGIFFDLTLWFIWQELESQLVPQQQELESQQQGLESQQQELESQRQEPEPQWQQGLESQWQERLE